jgi:hypothetical protein
MEKLATALLIGPPNEHVTVAVPPVPDDCRCQVHPTTPLLRQVLQRIAQVIGALIGDRRC